jgi:hypothetical protein
MTSALRSTRQLTDLHRAMRRPELREPLDLLPDLARPEPEALLAAHHAPWRDPGSPLFAGLVEDIGATWLGVPQRPLVIVTTADPAPAADEPAGQDVPA